MNKRKLNWTHAVLAAALTGLLVMPVAFAGAAGGGPAGLKKQVKSLKTRIAALESQTSLPPSGRAGGDLIGSYPRPEIGPDAVAGPEVIDGGLSGADIFPGSIGTGNLAPGSVSAATLGGGAVHGPALGAVQPFAGPGVAIAENESKEAAVSCPAGWRLLGGGYEWDNDPNGALITYTSPTFTGDASRIWVARGHVVDNGAANTLHAEALCLAP